MDHYVLDARTNRLTGPYTKAGAKQLVHDLNLQVLRCDFPILAEMGAKPTGPFYVKTTK